MFCNHCGKEVKDEATFCPYCGQPLSDRTAAREQPSDDPAGTAGKSASPKKKWIVVVVIVVIAAVAAAGIGVWLHNRDGDSEIELVSKNTKLSAANIAAADDAIEAVDAYLDGTTSTAFTALSQVQSAKAALVDEADEGAQEIRIEVEHYMAMMISELSSEQVINQVVDELGHVLDEIGQYFDGTDESSDEGDSDDTSQGGDLEKLKENRDLLQQLIDDYS